MLFSTGINTHRRRPAIPGRGRLFAMTLDSTGITKLENRAIRYLATAVEFGGISLAADHFGVSQPALSKAISRLEADLGVELLQRGQGARPTEAGEMVLRYALQTRRDLAELLSGLQKLRTGRGGVLRVGATQDWAQEVLPSALLELRERFGDVSATMTIGASNRLPELLREKSIDLYFGPIADEEVLQELHCEVFMRDWVDVYAERDNPIHGLRLAGLAELRAFPWGLPGPDTFIRRSFVRLFAAAGLAPPTPVVTSNSVALIAQVAARGGFLTYLSEIAAEQFGQGLLRRVDLPVARTPRRRGAVVRAGAQLTPLQRSFVDIARRVCGAGNR